MEVIRIHSFDGQTVWLGKILSLIYNYTILILMMI